jgi:hypothetical protein
MTGGASAAVALVNMLLLAACGEIRSSSGPDGSAEYKTWDLRMPLAKPSADGNSLLVAYQTFLRTRPIDEVLIRESSNEVGITVRGRVPAGALISIVWGFGCSQVPLRQPIGHRRIVDDSKHRYPGSESGMTDERAKLNAQQVLDAGGCQQVPTSRVKYV